jgi:arginine decarboxylase
MMYERPSHYFLCAGHAEGGSPLNAFDHALLDAGVGDTNLVRMSSILPPACQRVEPFELPGGALVPVAYARANSSSPGAVIAAAVAIAVPEDPTLPGLIMEHHAAGPLEQAVARVREMVVHGMRHRNRAVAEVITRGAEHVVERHGATFAGVVLWNGTHR